MCEECKICGNADTNRVHMVREMAFGLRDEFPYLECSKCGCLQLMKIPANMNRYYPSTYYSFQRHGWVKTMVRHQWSAHAYGKPNPLGWALSMFFVPNGAMQAVRRTGIAKDARVLDVGCGSGRLLLDLAHLGFRNLTGVDPFIGNDIAYENGVKVYKRSLNEMEAGFDLVMLHHSYEHMDAPREVMQSLSRLLKPGGKAIIRIPVASSFAWRTYGVNWVNLDAPRHFYLHTFKSIEFLTHETGLKIEKIIHEGNDEQFWASEQFARDIPSNDPRSIGASTFKRLAAWGTIRSCKIRAAELNQKGEGDLVCFHLLRI